MQEIFQIAWDKTLPVLSKLLDLLITFWQTVKPFFVKTIELLRQLIVFLGVVKVFLQNLLQDFITICKENYIFAKPLIIDFAPKNKVLTIFIIISILSILSFWFWMLLHANRKELVRKKLWIFFMLLTGPFGALIYYFGRKRVLEKKRFQQEKLILGFFSPMNERRNKEKQAD